MFYKLNIIVVLYLLLSPNLLYAKDNLLCKTYNITSNDVASYPKFVWQNKDYTAGVVVLIAGSLLIDKSVRTYVINHQNNTAKNLADDIKPFGNGYYMFPVVSILSLYGYLSDNSKLMDASLTSLESGFTVFFIISCVIVSASYGTVLNNLSLGNAFEFFHFSFSNYSPSNGQRETANLYGIFLKPKYKVSKLFYISSILNFAYGYGKSTDSNSNTLSSFHYSHSYILVEVHPGLKEAYKKFVF
ncbi:hypothetical protein DESAMIL20_1596 [Desulfurella amilsii]|uniref:Uncharacterized protein n=1 Tax=Desulfurella amilsii TaxID=1562698 RepID=A0A1X4XWY4_9BACT|nr:hypothetical protein [Desulfurella amilsii]OSS42043.1 hypothetical protein DESAMIL20_1596 [Desulfurella amilsii]